jgi:hypothetical protein
VPHLSSASFTETVRPLCVLLSPIRGPFKMRILRANIKAKNEEEYEALHVIRV